MTHRSTNHRRRGFSLTELAVVLAVIGTLIGAIWAASANVQNNSRANQAAQDIMQIAANVRSTFSAANSFTDVSKDEANTGSFVAWGIIPTDLIAPVGAANKVMNAWGGKVSVWENADGTHPRTFRVSFYGMSDDACFRVASQLASLGTTDGPFQMFTNSDGGTAYLMPQTGIPMSTATISTACGKNTGSATPSAEFDFNIH